MATVSQFIDPHVLINLSDKQREVIEGIVLGEIANNQSLQEAISAKLRPVAAGLQSNAQSS